MNTSACTDPSVSATDKRMPATAPVPQHRSPTRLPAVRVSTKPPTCARRETPESLNREASVLTTELARVRCPPRRPTRDATVSMASRALTVRSRLKHRCRTPLFRRRTCPDPKCPTHPSLLPHRVDVPPAHWLCLASALLPCWRVPLLPCALSSAAGTTFVWTMLPWPHRP